MATGTYIKTNNPVATYGENSASVLALQKKLNAQNAGKQGWTALAEDSKYGALTLAGVNWKPADTNVNAGNLNSTINSGNNIDTTGDEPATRNSVKTYDEIYKDITTSLNKDLPDRPEPVDYEQKFVDLKSKYGINDLETSLTDLQAQARDIQAISAERTRAEKGKAVPMNVIAGRVSEEEAQDNIRLQAVNDSIKTVTSQLQTKYNVVENLMKFTGQTYDDSVTAYNDKFKQNMDMMNMAKGITDDQKSDAEALADNARANLQIIYNNIADGGTSASALDPITKTNIMKLEVQAGLPSGFYANIAVTNPEANILSTTTRESNGTKYADVILKNKDGSLTTKTITLGGVSGGNSDLNESEKLRTATSAMSQDLDAMEVGGVLSKDDYITARKLWTSQAGYTSEQFDRAFSGRLSSEDKYELTQL